MSVPNFARIKEVQMRALDFKLKKVNPFTERPVNINVLRSSAPKLALVPASRYDAIYSSYMLIFVPSLIRIERGLENQ